MKSLKLFSPYAHIEENSRDFIQKLTVFFVHNLHFCKNMYSTDGKGGRIRARAIKKQYVSHLWKGLMTFVVVSVFIILL